MTGPVTGPVNGSEAGPVLRLDQVVRVHGVGERREPRATERAGERGTDTASVGIGLERDGDRRHIE